MPPKQRIASSKGILGVPRRAKDQILIFSRHAEELPSSDESDDGDYSPKDYTAETLARQKQQQHITNKTNQQSKRKQKNVDVADLDDESFLGFIGEKSNKKHKTIERKNAEKGDGHDNVSVNTAWSDAIPTEVLLLIFHYCVSTQGAMPLLGRLARVCRRWNAVCREPSLWRKLDLSHFGKYTISGDSLIQKLCGRGVMSGVEELLLDGWVRLTDKGVEMLVKQCSSLKTLSLSNCEKVTYKSAVMIAGCCQQLRSIDLSSTKVDQRGIKALLIGLKNVIEEILLRYCKNIKGPIGMNLLQDDKYPKLTLLDLSGNFVRNFHIEKLQVACPRLKQLQLGNMCLQTATAKLVQKESSKGFPDLEFFSIASSGQTAVLINDDFVHRMLSSSNHLKVLDLRGCSRITATAIDTLCASSLESLYLGSTDASLVLVQTAMTKWCTSLRALDLSGNTAVNDDCLSLFSWLECDELTSLDLSTTAVTCSGLRNVFLGCPKLNELNLTSCRGIDRGFKQKHIGHGNLKRLLGNIMSNQKQG
ncbi:F-box/LRR-repeat protein 6 [Nematostella vectensis]|uniref:F-box/LRR-repeat protein 6 n=1 Tax=Nematostella vectensis TaxID=45351 RepID=UPI0013906AF0|nr:F-box/LRR-repeat protein 6 [Nematostella vectensis]XP_032220111.1 F-box/LRR-repeat protein 6 [Nematostella vectensis]